MSGLDHPNFNGHESVHYIRDPESGLQAIVAIHSTVLGPAAGGCRLWHYTDTKSALGDVLNLARGMSYKNAVAGLDLGGGKAVIMRPEGAFDREALFKALGRAVEGLGGRYYTAEDVGVSPEDMRNVRTQTRYVAGLNDGENASGDPSPVTADGVFRGLKVAAKHHLKTQDLKGVRVAVQGLGHVGYALCEHLHAAGATLTVTDINAEVLQKAEQQFGAICVAPEDIYAAECEIFAPCAMGGAINPKTVEALKVKVVAGAANNQLASPDMGEILEARGILYAPDYVINAGGIMNVAAEIRGAYDPEWIEDKLQGLTQTLDSIFVRAKTDVRRPEEIADDMAEARIAAKKADRASGA